MIGRFNDICFLLTDNSYLSYLPSRCSNKVVRGRSRVLKKRCPYSRNSFEHHSEENTPQKELQASCNVIFFDISIVIKKEAF